MNKKEAIKDAKLKQKIFPKIGKMFLLRTANRGYFSVSETYYKTHDLKDRVRRVV